ncbi:HIRAN domain-containing protein [Microbacterium sp. LWO14-1.2]|uniref:HIRAN domain-containing protein n=1 Tax=unclassified Microbacterium TaxID=2609290 RepID=UPI00313A4552
MGLLDWFGRRSPPAVSPGRAGTPATPVLVSQRETASGITVSTYASGGPPVGYVSPYLSADEAEKLVHLDEHGLPNLRVVEFRGEWWLAETSTGRLVNAGSRVLRRLGIWSVRVRGDEHAPGTLRIGPATLVREPDNEFDANAVAVYQDETRCGYWNKGAARSLAKLLDSGQEMSAYAISARPPKVIAAEQRVLEHLVRRLRPT